MIELKDIEAARERIAGQVIRTPTTRCNSLDAIVGAEVYLKLDNLQTTGSFKERGALNKLLTLSEAEKRRGVIAASAGNHGQALARHSERLGIQATIVMPVTTPATKIASTRRFGAKVILDGLNYDAAFSKAMEIVQAEGATYVHAFDDDEVIAGQGTLGLEILDELPQIRTVVVPVGGGGMIGGIARAIKARRSDIKIIGVETALVPGMQAALRAGRPVEVAGGRTLADGIAVRRVSERTLELAKSFVDDIVLVEEEELASAILFLLEREKTVTEGAGAAGVAALLAGKIKGADGPLCAVVGGGNIDVTMLGRIIERGLVKDGRLVRLLIRIQDRPGGLAEVVNALARLEANIIQVLHERTFTQTLYNDVEVQLTLETRGHEHVEEIRRALLGIATKVEELASS